MTNYCSHYRLIVVIMKKKEKKDDLVLMDFENKAFEFMYK